MLSDAGCFDRHLCCTDVGTLHSRRYSSSTVQSLVMKTTDRLVLNMPVEPDSAPLPGLASFHY